MTSYAIRCDTSSLNVMAQKILFDKGIVGGRETLSSGEKLDNIWFSEGKG